jgi:hypothetical protein
VSPAHLAIHERRGRKIIPQGALSTRTFETITTRGVGPDMTVEIGPLNLLPGHPSHATTRTCQTYRMALTDLYSTHGAACMLDNCANVILRPSPSLHDS